MYDFLMRRPRPGLYRAHHRQRRGRLSSSVGEMAQDCGGCDMDLAKAPLKYDGLQPWEILLSEAQERMTLAVPPEKLDAFMDLAAGATSRPRSGHFTDTGYLHRALRRQDRGRSSTWTSCTTAARKCNSRRLDAAAACCAPPTPGSTDPGC
jgi:hypothetical protein